jgi:hypothetical protein
MVLIEIQVTEPCEMEHLHVPLSAHNRTNPQWDLGLEFRSSKNLALRELHIACFRPLEQQLTFIRMILERAPNLQSVVLTEDREKCEKCDAMALSGPPSALARPAFPKNKEEQDMVVSRVTDGTFFSGQIFFMIEKLY